MSNALFLFPIAYQFLFIHCNDTFAEYLVADENRFAEILARRSIKQVESEKKTVQSELRKSEMRIEIIPKLLKTLYEDKLSGNLLLIRKWNPCSHSIRFY